MQNSDFKIIIPVILIAALSSILTTVILNNGDDRIPMQPASEIDTAASSLTGISVKPLLPATSNNAQPSNNQQ